MRIFVCIFFIFVLALFAAPGIGLSEESGSVKTESSSEKGLVKAEETTPPKADEAQVPKTVPGAIQIATDRLEVDDKAKVIHLNGNVEIRWDQMVLTCSDADVFYHEVQVKKTGSSNPKKETEAKREITRLEANGHVKITMEDSVAVSDKAVYDAVKRQIILTGSPRVWRGKDFLTGDRIIVYLDEDRVVVESGPKKKVKATLYEPPAKSQKK